MPAWLMWVAFGFGVLSFIGTLSAFRKMRKKQTTDDNQDIGSIAKEGTTTSTIFGTVDMHGVYIEYFDVNSTDVEQKASKK